MKSQIMGVMLSQAVNHAQMLMTVMQIIIHMGMLMMELISMKIIFR